MISMLMRMILRILVFLATRSHGFLRMVIRRGMPDYLRASDHSSTTDASTSTLRTHKEEHNALRCGIVIHLNYGDDELRLSSHFDWSCKMEVRLANIRTLISSREVKINLLDNEGHSALDYAHFCISYLQTYLGVVENKAIKMRGQDAVNKLRCSFRNTAELDRKASKYFLACISMVLVREIIRMLKDAGAETCCLIKIPRACAGPAGCDACSRCSTSEGVVAIKTWRLYKEHAKKALGYEGHERYDYFSYWYPGYYYGFDF